MSRDNKYFVPSLSQSLGESTTLLDSKGPSERLTTAPPSGSNVSAKNLQDARRLLYVTHFFNQFSESTWQFCLTLFMAAFTSYRSLILVTTYGLVSYSFLCFFGSTAGRFVDRANRLQVAQQFIGFENCAVLLATTMCYILLSRQRQVGVDQDSNDTKDDSRGGSLDGIPTDPVSLFLLAGIHLLGAIACVLDSGFLVAIERDWIVVMSKSAANDGTSNGNHFHPSDERYKRKQKDWLSDTNVCMRQIDLACKIAGPFFAGVVVAFFDDSSQHPLHGYHDLRGAALLVGGLNALALVVEYICAAKIYYDIADLAIRSSPSPVLPDSSTVQVSSTQKEVQDNIETKLRSARFLSCAVPENLVIYFSQPICWAGFSLALLYLNVVLTFGGIMTAYLVWRGMSMEFIGLWRGVSSLAGLAGTFIYPLMAKRTGLIEVGMVSIAFQLLCLTSCYGSLFVDSRSGSFVMLIAGVCFSRLGLWVFDISVTQLMQLHIPPPIRGLVGGVQKSLNAFFTLAAYSVGLFISNPQFFYIYASMAYAGVALAATFYSIQVYAKRNQIFAAESRQSSIGVSEDC